MMMEASHFRVSPEVRFWVKVKKTENGCWDWLASKNSDGYGNFKVNGFTDKAHRFSYELHKGIIPEGMVIDHLCKNRACVNPDHLEVVTPRENIMRGYGVAVRCARATHCPYGHPYSGDNLDLRTYKSNGKEKTERRCRTCHNERSAEYQRRRRASK